MISMRALRHLLLVLPMLALAACSSVGKGNKIESLQIKDAIYGQDVSANLQLYPCLRYNFEALGVFTDKSTGVYTDRATWSSSNQAIVKVSNGDIILPSDSTKAYAKGTVIPVSAGTASITVDYVGLKATINVTVAGSVPAITLHPFSSVLPRPMSADNGTLTIAPRTVQNYVALATLPNLSTGRVTDVTAAAQWSVVSPNTTCTNTNTINLTCDPVEFVKGSTSSFRAKPLDDSKNPIKPDSTTSKTIQADFNSIVGMTSCPKVSATLTVAPFDSTVPNPIAIVSEYDASGKTDGASSVIGQIPALYIGTTDRLKAYGTLRDASSAVYTQNISELGVTGDGTTGATGYGLPIIPSTDTSSNVTVTNNPETASSPATTTTTDCRRKDLSIFTFLSGLFNLIYGSGSGDTATPVDPVDGSIRNFYATFITKPATTTTTSAQVTCPDKITMALPMTTDALSVTSAKFARQTRTGMLTSIDLCAVGANTPVNSCSSPGGTMLLVPNFLQYPEDSDRIQLRAIGHFTPVSGPSDTQDITRKVTWTSSDSSIIGVLNASLTPAQAGQATALKAGTVNITATYTNAAGAVTTNTTPFTLTAQ